HTKKPLKVFESYHLKHPYRCWFQNIFCAGLHFSSKVTSVVELPIYNRVSPVIRSTKPSDQVFLLDMPNPMAASSQLVMLCGLSNTPRGCGFVSNHERKRSLIEPKVPWTVRSVKLIVMPIEIFSCVFPVFSTSIFLPKSLDSLSSSTVT